MDQSELMNLFGLNKKPKEVKTPYKPPGGFMDDSPAESQVLLPTVLKLDEWDLMKGEELVSKNKSLWGMPNTAMADFYGACWQSSPELVENCEDKNRAEYVKTMLDAPDFKSLRTSTVNNLVASEIASERVAKEWLVLQKEHEKIDEKIEQQERKGKAFSPERKEGLHDLANLRAAGVATKEAREEVDQLDEACRSCGLGQGDAGAPLDPKKIAQVYHQIKDNDTLRAIFNKAGRYRRYAQAQQRQRVKHGYDDMVGVELSGDVSRLLPIELSKLTDETLELDAMRRLVENQCQSRQFQGVEKLGKGPIVVVVDESGSMSGEKIEEAKAFALAMAWIARHQKRFMVMVGFSGGEEGNYLVIPPGKNNEVALMEWLSHFFGGGTILDVPLVELPKKWSELACPKGKTDCIILTDAIVHCQQEMADFFNAWKEQEKVKVTSLIIGEPSPGDLAKVSNEVYIMDEVGLGEEGIKNCLSI